jgi:hypothetical protein
VSSWREILARAARAVQDPAIFPKEHHVSATRPRPEQSFFADPALDRMFGVVMALASEVYVLRDRLRTMETLLVRKGGLDAGALDAWKPEAGEQQAIAADRDAFVAHLLDNLLGEQVSKGPL